MDRHLRSLQGSMDAELDPFEFARQRIWISDKDKKIVRLEPNFLQRRHQETKNAHIRAGKVPHFLTLKYRKGGITTWEQGLSYRAAVTIPNADCVTLAQTEDDTIGIFRMVNLMGKMDESAPPDLRIGKRSIEVPSLHTIFQIATAGSKVTKRGQTPYRIHGSEVAFWPGSTEEIENLIAGLEEAAGDHEVNLETTANGAYGWFFETYSEAQQGRNAWIPLFYPWFIDPSLKIKLDKDSREEILDTPEDEEKEVMEKYDLSFEQIAWRRRKKFQRKKLFPQEFPEAWQQAFLVRGTIFFDEWDFEYLDRNRQEPLDKHDTYTIWERPQKGQEYICGADTAEGNENSDFSVAAFLNKQTGNQAAVLRGRWKPEVFGRKCVEWCKRYNGATFGCEINNHGHSTMNTVVNQEHYSNLYWHEKELDKKVKGRRPKERKPGWLTNGSTRPILLDELNEAVRENFMQVNDPVLLSEARTFVDTGGRYEADKKQHDDTVFAWGIAWQVRKQRKVQYVYS